MARVLGIDLGTTYCAMATLDSNEKPVTVPNSDGDILTPSAVLLTEGSIVVGQAALDLYTEMPDRVATLIKRRMGKTDYGRMIAGREFRPETLSAVILRKLFNDATKRLGPIDSVVVTVPAYFDDTRRQATMDAARIAGLPILDIFDEPSAAAFAYAAEISQPVQPQTILVYDLGGGTFDVSLVRLSPKRFHVLAIDGDVRLGGQDWDERLLVYISQQFQKDTGTDPRSQDASLANLSQAVEKAKRALSKLPQTSITCTAGGQSRTFPITREQFERLTYDLIVRTKGGVQNVLRSANLDWSRVDKVLLVGGSTHMPMISRMMESFSGKPPERNAAVSELVARGAALQAAMLKSRQAIVDMEDSDHSQLSEIVEISVNAHGLGVEVRARQPGQMEKERINDILIPRNTQLPAQATRIYRTAKDNQDRVRVKILQGDVTQAEACLPIGECWITGLPGRLPKKSPIQVRCTVKTNGIIEVSAVEMTFGTSAKAELIRKSGLTPEAIETEKAWLLAQTIS